MGKSVTKFLEEVEVLGNDCLAPNCYRLRLKAPKTAEAIKPGQFVHLSVAEATRAMLRRPFSIFDADIEGGSVTIMYEVKGQGTEIMREWEAGQESDLIAPLGNSWTEKTNPKNALLVGGGFGGAPLYMLAKELLSKSTNVSVVLGAKTSDLLILEDYFAVLDLKEFVVATDDGSKGFDGFCTIPASEMIRRGEYDYVATCGPTPVMKAVSETSMECDVNCEVSYEAYMACGVGACKTCVVDTDEGKVRSCTCGPVFSARCVKW